MPGAVVGAAATIVTAPFWVLTAPPYYYGYYGPPYYSPPAYYAPRYYTTRRLIIITGRAEPAPVGSDFGKYGGLISYSTEREDVDRAAAAFVDKILKGAKAAELPVQQPTTFEPLINSKIAKALGLTVPQSLLARADEIIE